MCAATALKCPLFNWPPLAILIFPASKRFCHYTFLCFYLVYLLLISFKAKDGRTMDDGRTECVQCVQKRPREERSSVVCSGCTAVQRTPVSSDPLLTGATSEPWFWLGTQCNTDKRHVWHVWWARADMTVLTEDTSPVIMTSGLGGDRYITPEYLAPLPQVYFLIFIIRMGFRAPSRPSWDNLIWILCPKNVVTT